MESVRGYLELPRRLTAPVVVLGNFDGVHRGHQHLFAHAKSLCRKLIADGAPRSELVALTFDPHPTRLLAPSFAPPLISTTACKLRLLAEAGVDVAVLQPFDSALAQTSPEEFFAQVLQNGLGAKVICVGYDFTFGRQRSGTTDKLHQLAAAQHIEVVVVPPFSVDGLVCSSTKVREFVLEGRVDGARLLLGRDFAVEGVVVHGDGRGRSIGIPTANLKPETELLPAPGVYAGSAEFAGERVLAAINVGSNPTFVSDGINRPHRIEAHLLDVSPDLYGQALRVAFHTRLRAETRFNSATELVAQIQRDIAEVRRLSAG